MVASTRLVYSAPAPRHNLDASDRPTIAREEAALYDTELVRRFRAGDDSAFVEIIHRYRERMFNVAFGVLRNRADAEEIAQDTFVRAHRGLAKFRGDSSLSTWLHRITLNLARNRYGYFFRRQRHATISLHAPFSGPHPGTISELIASDAATPVRAAAVSEFTELVALCLARMGASHREVLRLRNSLNHSYEEIARELGISSGTVKSRIARARENLRALLAEVCPEFGVDAEPDAWFDPIRAPGGVVNVRT